MVSLFTDRVAPVQPTANDVAAGIQSPTGAPGTVDADPRGWWGDGFSDIPIGSRLWQLRRAIKVGTRAMPYQLASVWSPTYERNSTRAANLITDAFPSTTLELLTEWEATLGLPDPCAGTSPTIQQRRAQVVARLTDNGGGSVACYVAFAAALGFDITITEYAPARADLLRVEQPLYDPDWAYAWTINTPGTAIAEFTVDESYVEEPLTSWGSAVLQCEFNRIRPAHTILLFAYTGDLSVGTWGTAVWGGNTWGCAMAMRW
nr:putative phage tail protein [Komagataeibacter swingsii]